MPSQMSRGWAVYSVPPKKWLNETGPCLQGKQPRSPVLRRCECNTLLTTLTGERHAKA